MQLLPLTRAEHRLSDWPIAAKSILGFWVFYALTVVARAWLGTDPVTELRNRLLLIGFGIILTALIYLALAAFGRGRSLARRAVIAAAGSFLAAGAMSGFQVLADRIMADSKEQVRYQAREGFVIVEQGRRVRIERMSQAPLEVTLPRLSELDSAKQFRIAANLAVMWLFFFAAWSAFYLAMVAQRDALEAQQRAADAEGAAQAAQVRALRYQVNPHFLFNTLNSLSSLVMTGRSDRAETMLLALSTFFRSTLSLDPTADVTLAEEIDLQRLYLDIEKARFPDRLQVEIDVPEELEQARLPALILQPIVENAIKYGVSTTRKTVVVSIAARTMDDGRMCLEISNRLKHGGKDALGAATHEGTGLGLSNVSQRLQARFGRRGECRFGPMTEGGYKVALTMPVERRG
ncbi:sensor histidine kinase [Sphingomonas piscis]|uniref:Sensor histidine kinase n=1 Tax=Sphingomonas piscis TaxID=2714943 RepID=A0A6G7YMG8_9SPHN|nr:histidine kinase [Sphingomonas piscis]QIK77932.1 sensor histidine kinase [Sphingomonas piscis]